MKLFYSLGIPPVGSSTVTKTNTKTKMWACGKKPLSDQNVRALRFLKSLYRREKISLSDLKTPFLGLAKNDVLLLI